MAVFCVAAVIFAIGWVITQAGASRVFWALFGYQLGRRHKRKEDR